MILYAIFFESKTGRTSNRYAHLEAIANQYAILPEEQNADWLLTRFLLHITH